MKEMSWTLMFAAVIVFSSRLPSHMPRAGRVGLVFGSNGYVLGDMDAVGKPRRRRLSSADYGAPPSNLISTYVCTV